jgi:hypothetical protein
MSPSALQVLIYLSFLIAPVSHLYYKRFGQAHTPKVARVLRLSQGERLLVSSIIPQIGSENKCFLCRYFVPANSPLGTTEKKVCCFFILCAAVPHSRAPT